jgi:hypothetical protein
MLGSGFEDGNVATEMQMKVRQDTEVTLSEMELISCLIKSDNLLRCLAE